MFFGNVLGQAFFLVGMVYLARTIGPQAFGWWSFAQAVALYVLRVGEFGLEVTGIRAIAKNQAILPERVGLVLGIRMVFAAGLLLLTLVALLLGFVPHEAQWLLAFFLLTVFPVGLSVEWLFEAQQSVAAVGVARVLKGFLFGVLVLLFVKSSSDAELSAIFYVVSLVVPALYVLQLARQRYGIKKVRLTADKAKELLSESWPIAAATLLSQYSLFFGTTFLGYIAGGTEVGLFSAAHRMIMFVWAYGITVAHRVLLPTFSRMSDESKTDFRSLLRSTCRFMVILAVPLGVVATVVSTDFIHFVYGEEYVVSGKVFGILLWALVIGTVRSPLEIGLIASSQQRVYLRGMLLYGLFHTLFGPLGYTRGGLEGLALGAVVAEACYALYLVVVVEGVMTKDFALLFMKPLAAGLLTFGVLWFVTLPWGLMIVLGLAVYVGSLILLGELTESDFGLLKQLAGISTTSQVH